MRWILPARLASFVEDVLIFMLIVEKIGKGSRQFCSIYVFAKEEESLTV